MGFDRKPPKKRMASLDLDNQISESLGERLDVDYGLWDLLSKSLAERPDADAVVSLWQQDIANNKIKNCPLRWSYAALNDKSDHLANWLLQQGCERGMHLAVFLWNSAEWVLFFWAAAKLRMPFIPLDPRALASDGSRLLGLTNPTVVAVQDSEAARLLQKSASPALVSVNILISCDDTHLEKWTSLSGILASFQDIPGQQSENPAPYQSTQPPNKENSISYAKALREDDQRHGRGDDIAVIIFTSGTTSNSKGCPYTAACCWSASNRFDPNPDPGFRDCWLVHTPVSHIFSINHCLRAFGQGDTVVFASKSFDVKATLRALVEAECTRMSAVPTMVKALLSDPTFPGIERLKLRYVAMGSTMILEEDIRQAKEGFGSEAVIQSYGMSEGAPIASWRRTDPLLKDGFHPGVGKVLPGANLRICEPGSARAISRGEVGEIHIGGSSVIPHYLHNFDSRSFYQDNFGHWLVTGDQGRMDKNGVLHVLGRYKDLIIRGGENIAPLQIESVLNQIPNVTAQVIGVPDPLAGEVPVAVVKTSSHCPNEKIAAKAMDLGPIYALDGIYTLEVLGLEKFPMTASGKVRKDELKKIVLEYRKSLASADSKNALDTIRPNGSSVAKRSESKDLADFTPFRGENVVHNGSPEPLVNPEACCIAAGESKLSTKSTTCYELAQIWESIVGFYPPIDIDVSTFADSITLLRYSDRIWKTLRKEFYLQDCVDHPTIEKQASLLEQRRRGYSLKGVSLPIRSKIPANAPSPLAWTSSATLEPERVTRGQATNLLYNANNIQNGHNFETENLPIASADAKGMHEIKTAARVVLDTLRLSWDNVEDVLPVKDYFHHLASGSRPQTWYHRTLYKIQCESTVTLRKALEKALSTRPLFRTLLAKLPDKTPIHLVIRACQTLFDQTISEIELNDHSHLAKLVSDESDESFSHPRMVDAIIITIKGSDEIFLSMTYNHSVFDALSFIPWYRDLDQLISNPDSTIKPLTPFKLYAELTCINQSNALAQESVNFNIRRLRGISKFSRALWPPSRAPGLKISRHLWIPKELEAIRKKPPTIQELQKMKLRRLPGNRLIHVPTIGRLRTDHQIEASLVFKTVIALFNILETGQEYAIFSGIDAARSWPFVPDWLGRTLPPAMSIDGPTIERSINMISIPLDTTETVGQLLRRIAQDQVDLSKHAHAPWFKVLEGLGEEASFAADAAGRQLCNWDISLRFMNGAFESQTMKVVGRCDWPDVGLFWNACMMDKENIILMALWDSSHITEHEMDGCLNKIVRIFKIIADIENFEKRVSDVLKEFRDLPENREFLGLPEHLRTIRYY